MKKYLIVEEYDDFKIISEITREILNKCDNNYFEIIDLDTLEYYYCGEWVKINEE